MDGNRNRAPDLVDRLFSDHDAVAEDWNVQLLASLPRDELDAAPQESTGPETRAEASVPARRR